MQIPTGLQSFESTRNVSTITSSAAKLINVERMQAYPSPAHSVPESLHKPDRCTNEEEECTVNRSCTKSMNTWRDHSNRNINYCDGWEGTKTIWTTSFQARFRLGCRMWNCYKHLSNINLARLWASFTRKLSAWLWREHWPARNTVLNWRERMHDSGGLIAYFLGQSCKCTMNWMKRTLAMWS
jgi:hypothetical protein